MSIRFKLMKTVYKHMGTKKLFGLPEKELLAKVAKYNKGRNFAIPKDKKCVYTDIKVGGHDHCLKMQQPGTHREKAMLFLFGGGMVLGPDAGDRKAGQKLGFSADMDVWMPWYPLCPERTMQEAVQMVWETYRLMLWEYRPENIVFCGFSSGAYLAICTCLHNLRQQAPLPNPGCILASSPGAVPHCAEERQKMRELAEKDIMIDPAFLNTMVNVLGGGQALPDYMLATCIADFTGMPPIHFWWGTDEVLVAEAPYYIESCKKAGVSYTVEIGEGMCHCYPMLDIFPEGKAAQEQMRGYIRALC